MGESPEPAEQSAPPEDDEDDSSTWPPFQPYYEAITSIDAGPPPWSIYYRKSLWQRFRERIANRNRS